LKTIRDAWGRVAGGSSVTILCRDTDLNLRAACQLHELGVRVRLTSKVPMSGLSFHIFRRLEKARVILDQIGDLPSRGGSIVLDSLPLADELTRAFESAWHSSRSVADTLAGRIGGSDTLRRSKQPIGDRLDVLLDEYRAGQILRHEVRLRIALTESARCIFIVGPPGVGKSTLRRILAAKLTAMGQGVEEITDYPLLYEDFLVDAVGSNPSNRFVSDNQGGFRILDADVLVNVLRRLSAQAARALSVGRVSLIEFARSNLEESLAQFDSTVGRHSQLIYLTASEEVRRTRLLRRTTSPQPFVEGFRVGLVVSDDHPISNEVLERFYARDDFLHVKSDPQWNNRLHWIDTGADIRMPDDLSLWVDSFLAAVSRKFWEGGQGSS
jgi:shikimate kinase